MPLYSVMIQMIISRTMQKYWQIVEPTLAWPSVDLILAAFPIQVCDPLKGGTSTSVWHAHGDQFWSARADFPRKISKETKETAALLQNIQKTVTLMVICWRIESRERKKVETFQKRKAYPYWQASCWFTIWFLASSNELDAFKRPLLPSLLVRQLVSDSIKVCLLAITKFAYA